MTTFEKNPNGGTNYVLEGDGFYLSFNAAPCADMSFFRSDSGGSETALAVEDGKPDGGTLWLILNGDFRKEYEEAFARGIEGCLAVYESHRSTKRSSWSTDYDEAGFDVLNWLAARAGAVKGIR